jgi:hypothetical protein
MGATLAHLCVVEYDLTTMTAREFRCSIDFAGSDPLEKADNQFPITNTHKVVRTIHIPLVMESVVAQVWEHCVLQTTTIDASHVRVLPIHKVWGGTSKRPRFRKVFERRPGILFS